MNQINLRSIIISKPLAKSISLIFGFCFWYILSKSLICSIYIDVPISVHNIDENKIVEFPKSVNIELAGKIVDLYNLCLANITLNINCQELKLGRNSIELTNKNLLLPKQISIKNICPCNPVIWIETKEPRA